jgi:hypothetical protein
MKLTDSSEKSVSLELVKKSGIKKNEMHMSALTIEFEVQPVEASCGLEKVRTC